MIQPTTSPPHELCNKTPWIKASFIVNTSFTDIFYALFHSYEQQQIPSAGVILCIW